MRALFSTLTGTTVLAPILLIPLAVSASASGNPHFVKSATSLTGSGSTVTVAFKEAGLSSGTRTTVVASALGATSYACVNGGGLNPAASNKKTFSTAITRSGAFTADRSGRVVGSLTLSPPTAASLGFSCPKGQRTTFVSVTYSGVTLTDSTSGATTGVLGSYSWTNPAAPLVR